MHRGLAALVGTCNVFQTCAEIASAVLWRPVIRHAPGEKFTTLMVAAAESRIEPRATTAQEETDRAQKTSTIRSAERRGRVSTRHPPWNLQTSCTSSCGQIPPRWRPIARLARHRPICQRSNAVHSSTTGSSGERTKNTLTPHVISIARFHTSEVAIRRKAGLANCPGLPNQVPHRNGKGRYRPCAPDRVCRLFTSSEQRLAEGLVTLKEPLKDLSVLKCGLRSVSCTPTSRRWKVGQPSGS